MKFVCLILLTALMEPTYATEPWLKTKQPKLKIDSPMPKFVSSSVGGNGNRTKKLMVLMSHSYSGEMPVGAISTAAMKLALDRLHMDRNWLPGYELTLELVDDECIDSSTINKVLPKLEESQLAENRVPLFLSPGCEAFGLRTVAESLKFYNYIGIATIQTSLEPALNRKRYNSFFSLGERIDTPFVVLVDFMAKFGWRKLAILSEKFRYYDQIEQNFLPLLDENNMTIVWMGKVSHAGVFDEEMEPAMSDMKRFDPRIIIVNADRGAGKACWLHKYGFFGPNHVTFFFYWSDVYPTPVVPDNLGHWCSLQMINEVLTSSFVLGDASITYSKNQDWSDATGLSGHNWELEMESQLDNPKQSPLWGYWRFLPYDLVLFAGNVLNATESLLRRNYNSTLANWVTSSELFLKNGTNIVETMKEAVFSSPLKGLKGEYQFERSTLSNSKGYTPITISQLSLEEDRHGVMVALYHSNAQNNTAKLSIFDDRINWKTSDGKPPPDAILVVPLEKYFVSTSVFVTLLTLAGLELFCCLLLFASLTSIFRRLAAFFNCTEFKRHDVMLLSGNVIILCQIFAIPFGQVTVNNCFASSITLMLGFPMSLFGILLKLEECSRSQPHRPSSRFLVINALKPAARRKSEQVIPKFWISVIIFVWLCIQIALLAIFLSYFPILLEKQLLPIEKIVNNSNLVYQPFRFACKFGFKGFDDPALATLGIISLIQIFSFLRSAFLAYKLRSKRFLTGEQYHTTTCVYCIAVILMGTSFLSILLEDQLFVVIPSCVLCYVAVTTLFSICSKFAKEANTITQWSTASRVRPLTVVLSTEKQTEGKLDSRRSNFRIRTASTNASSINSFRN